MQARYYDPVIGRFYSNDPVGAMSHFNTLNGIHGFNRYGYANNNPYKFIDPSGLASEKAVEKVKAVASKSPQAQVAVSSIAIATSITIQSKSEKQDPAKVMGTVVKTNPVTAALTSIPGVGEVVEKGLDDMLNPPDVKDMTDEQIQEGNFDGRVRVDDIDTFIERSQETTNEDGPEETN